MNSIMRSFKDKRFRYGSFSTVMVVVVIGVLVLVNLVVDQLNISRDLTREQLFSLSTGSLNVIRELEADVRIYSLWPTGQENFLFQQLLEEYGVQSSRITVNNRDPFLHPTFVERFAAPEESIADGSIIVVGPERYRVIHAADLVTTQFNWQTFRTDIVSFNIEPQVTNAINFVVAEDTPVIYRMIGNNEFPLPPSLLQEIEVAGFEVRDINLLLEDVPEDAAMLLITFPERDWSPDQAERILHYLQNDGRAMFLLGYRAARFPRMDEVLAAFGIRIGDYVVIEGNPNHFFRNNPLMKLPEFVSSEITDSLIERDFMPLLFQSTGIDILDLRRASTNIYPLIRTSGQAYGRSDPEVEVVTRVPQDIGGPFNLAVTVEDSMFVSALGRSLTTRMVVVGSEFILAEDLNIELGGANWGFLINSLNWLQDAPASVFIPAQTPPTVARLTITTGQAGMITLFSVIVLPLTFAVAGLVVWLRRRNA